MWVSTGTNRMTRILALRSKGASGPAVPAIGELRAYLAGGWVYCCDRGNDRMQVLTKQGKFGRSLRAHPDAGHWLGLQFAFRQTTTEILVVDDGEHNVIWTVLPRRRTVVGDGHRAETTDSFTGCIRSATRKAICIPAKSTPANAIQKCVLQH